MTPKEIDTLRTQNKVLSERVVAKLNSEIDHLVATYLTETTEFSPELVALAGQVQACPVYTPTKD